MNVYQKLQKCRVALQEANVRKSGKNSFAGYDYYELSDFMPHVNRLFSDHGLFSHVTFTAEVATLTIINADKPEEQVVFTSPMAEANLKGCHPIQNLGAVQTYQRRYLYQMAMEIVEHDALDATQGGGRQEQSRGGNRQRAPQGRRPSTMPSAPPPRQNSNGASRNGGTWQMSDAQRARLFAIANDAGVGREDVRALVERISGQDSTAALTREQYDAICEMLQAQGQASA